KKQRLTDITHLLFANPNESRRNGNETQYNGGDDNDDEEIDKIVAVAAAAEEVEVEVALAMAQGLKEEDVGLTRLLEGGESISIRPAALNKESEWSTDSKAMAKAKTSPLFGYANGNHNRYGQGLKLTLDHRKQ
ncbi:hypothetical protein RFI_33333, partial [Reticulomyxa filosa]